MIDNGATTTQLIFLANVAAVTSCASYRNAFNRGLDFLLNAQYANGGWPQVFPVQADSYSRHITFNDGAMTNVLYLLRDIGNKLPKYAFVDAARVTRSSDAVPKGIDCILKTQIVVNGAKTGWCAQHDSVTFAAARARAYELPSISGFEGAQVFQFLMTVENPSPAIIAAVQGAAAWYERAKLTGIRTEKIVDASGLEDVRVVQDPSAPPIWARFYEISTSVPFFCGRDGVKKQTLAEIEQERRAGYNWYGYWPSEMLSRTYPAWVARWVTPPRPDSGTTSDGAVPAGDASGSGGSSGGGGGGGAGGGGVVSDASAQRDQPISTADAGGTNPSSPDGAAPSVSPGAGPAGGPGSDGKAAGCACSVATDASPTALAAVLLLALGVPFRRRGRRGPKPV
jgi:PelA/Pel-15E family pectate lyase